MFCHHCGASIAKDSKFCSKCGATITPESKIKSATAAPKKSPLSSKEYRRTIFAKRIKGLPVSPLFIATMFVLTILLFSNLLMGAYDIEAAIDDVIDETTSSIEDDSEAARTEEIMEELLDFDEAFLTWLPILGIASTALTALGMWMTFYAALSPSKNLKTNGLKLIITTLYIAITVSIYLLFYVYFHLMDQSAKIENKSGEQLPSNVTDSFTMAFFVFVLGAFLIWLCLSRFISTLRSICETIELQSYYEDMPTGSGIVCFISAGTSFFASLNSEVSVSTVLSIVSSILLGCLIFYVRNRFEAFSRDRYASEKPFWE